MKATLGLFLLGVTSVSSYILPRTVADVAGQKCKCYEGDTCWPSVKDWNALNKTVGGALVKVIPPGAPCYNEFEGIKTYDAEKCAAVTRGWLDQQFMIEGGAGPIRQYPSNNTCVPTTNPAASCTIGYLAEYVIMATKDEHIKAGINFARKTNVHLAVRNTGHDFNGRSIASGSLTINTHNFKKIEFTKAYKGAGDYTGGAVTLGAGIQGREMYRQANAQSPPVVVIGGECPTVGFSGGYIQGGGHGPLSSYHGMAADHALEFKGITAEGNHFTANAKENKDLFWALKGGGPATFGVLTQITVKTFPELKVAGAMLDINSTHTTDVELFWKAVDAFHSFANLYTENKMFVYYELMELRLHIQPFTAPGLNAAQLNKILEPLITKLNELGIKYTTRTKEFNTFFEMYTDMFEDERAGDNTIIGGRGFTHDDVKNNQAGLTKAFRNAVKPAGYALPGILIGHIVAPGVGRGGKSVDNAIHPGWNNITSFSIAALFVAPRASLAEKDRAWDVLTHSIDAQLIANSPDGVAYVSEGNIEHPDWQEAFWGANYDRLFSIRQKWDPNNLFYAKATVGTENWDLVGEPPKLCKIR